MARNPLARPPPVRKTAAQVIVHTEIVDYLPLSNGTSRDVPPGFLLARSPADRMSTRHPAGRYPPHWRRLPRDRRWTARPLTPAAPPGPLGRSPCCSPAGPAGSAGLEPGPHGAGHRLDPRRRRKAARTPAQACCPAGRADRRPARGPDRRPVSPCRPRLRLRTSCAVARATSSSWARSTGDSAVSSRLASGCSLFRAADHGPPLHRGAAEPDVGLRDSGPSAPPGCPATRPRSRPGIPARPTPSELHRISAQTSLPR